jgi:predicted enzyme related to lactoylglutathione lyase
MVNDVAKARAFYSKVFDWKLEASNSSEYVMIKTGAPPFGGMMAKPPMAPMPSLNVYFSVPSADETLRKVVELGATIIVPKTEVPAMGWFAMFLDPDGIPVGIFEERAPG